jgi:REP element-mobilizing transposase RayT
VLEGQACRLRNLSPVAAGVPPAESKSLQPTRLPLQLWWHACRVQVAPDAAVSTVGTMIKDRPHRLDLIYINQPLYFVTFATRDRKRIPSLDVAQAALEQYGHCAKGKFNVAVGRYVIMPDHVHLFVRGDRSFTLSSWIGGLKRAMCVALKLPRLWQPGFF